MDKTRRYPVPSQCPVCGDQLEVVRVQCGNCGTGMDGHFSPGRFANLSQQQWHFIETFVRCKGKIKDVEVALDISYPTVVSRLNDVVRALGFDVGDDAAEMRRVAAAEEKRRDTLEKLSKGEISPKDALRAFDSDAAAE
jgi:hypothetical protein